jgi:serine/threonine-protein kinase HipA
MGALEYAPEVGDRPQSSHVLEVQTLAKLADQVMNDRDKLLASVHDDENINRALQDIVAVGTSAGGMRAKAIVAWNPGTQEIRSGQIRQPDGFEYWILKFDGIAPDSAEFGTGQGYGAIEFAYSLMAQDIGITMTQCRLLEENGRRHFMTQRYDRTSDGEKLHKQSLSAMRHIDYNQPGAYSYEQAMHDMRVLEMKPDAIEQQFRRMAFNIVARNQDDHVKNIDFLMDRSGEWSLSPAFDLTPAYNPSGEFTSQHQMAMSGKLDGFTRSDFANCEHAVGLKVGRGIAILDEVIEGVKNWPAYADQANVAEAKMEAIRSLHRLDLSAQR